MTEYEWSRNFSRMLKLKLIDAHMSQKELAKYTSISESSLSKCLKGGVMPSMKMIINLSIGLTCSIDDLMEFDDYIMK